MSCQDHLYRNRDPRLISRRWFFEQCSVGLGAVALGQLLEIAPFRAQASLVPADPLAPKKPHYTPKAKNIIFLFMAGAPSHLELLTTSHNWPSSTESCRLRSCWKATGPPS